MHDASRQLFLSALNGRTPGRVPVWLMRQAGRYLPEYRAVRGQAGDFLTLCYTPSLASEVTLQPIRRFDLDAAIIFSDILVVPHALGQAVWFEEGEGPRLEPVEGLADLPKWNERAFMDHLGPVFDAVSLTRAQLPADKALIGFAGAPWTLACYMIYGGGSRDFAMVRRHAMADPERFQALIDRLCDAIVLYLSAKVRAGADALQIFDSWAGVLSAAEFERWVIRPTAAIVRRLRENHPDVPVIGFPRLAGYNYGAYIAKTGVQAASFDSAVPPERMADFQGRVCVQGNLDPLLLLTGGRAMEAQAGHICEILSGGPFVFNLGHGVDKHTPPDHVARLVDFVHNWTADR